MEKIVVRPLRKNEKRRLYEFVKTLPERDLWGKKGRLLKEDLHSFQRFFTYIKPFHPKCFLVAEENNELAGFVVAVYNPQWIDELAARYGHDIEKRAHILGVAFTQRRNEILTALICRLSSFFSQKGVRSVEYPTLGNVCLTTATDVLTSENVDALMTFREAGFKISECYYSMKLDLDRYECDNKYLTNGNRFSFQKRSIEIVRENRVLGKVVWDAVKDGKTNIGICVKQIHRGKGLGTALIARALLRLKGSGVKTVELGVDGNNLPALKLYRKFGFEVYATHFYVILPC
jgi:GNAT superfamily N-acetyltransferase